MSEPHEEMAIISDVSFGMDDRDRVSLMFTVNMLDGNCAGQWLPEQAGLDAIRESGVSDVHRLNGRACVVSTDGQMSRYVRMLKVG